jgi:hypothetical protein
MELYFDFELFYSERKDMSAVVQLHPHSDVSPQYVCFLQTARHPRTEGRNVTPHTGR